MASSGDLLHHSLVKRDAKKRKAKKGGTRNKRKRAQNRRNGKKKTEEKRKRRKNTRKSSTRVRGARTKQSINYTQCAMKMKEFASRIKKAGNIVRQSKRVTDFKKINDNKKGKVIKL